jgi:hypothetical protein
VFNLARFTFGASFTLRVHQRRAREEGKRAVRYAASKRVAGCKKPQFRSVYAFRGFVFVAFRRKKTVSPAQKRQQSKKKLRDKTGEQQHELNRVEKRKSFTRRERGWRKES